MSVAGAGTGEAAPGGGEAAAGGEQQAAQQQAGVPPNFAERFEQFMGEFSGVGERLQRVESALAEPQSPEEAQQPRNPDTRYLLDTETGLFFDRLTGEWHEDAPDGLGGGEEPTREEISQMIQDGIREGIQPFQQHNLRQQYAALEEAYPELRDKEIVAEIAAEGQRLVAETPGADPEAWKSPRLLETLYLARAARKRAESEVPADGQPSTTLEDPAAATAGAKELEDEGDAIVNAGQRGSFFR